MPEVLHISTQGRGFTNITREVAACVHQRDFSGVVHVFLRHTSASLLLTENADPDVRIDLETLIARAAPDGDPAYHHADEGPDDMAAHFRTLLAGHELTIPVKNGQMLLGTWQGIFLWEHRTHPHRREVVITLLPQA